MPKSGAIHFAHPDQRGTKPGKVRTLCTLYELAPDRTRPRPVQGQAWVIDGLCFFCRLTDFVDRNESGTPTCPHCQRPMSPDERRDQGCCTRCYTGQGSA
jgi:hypothetical protein